MRQGSEISPRRAQEQLRSAAELAIVSGIPLLYQPHIRRGEKLTELEVTSDCVDVNYTSHRIPEQGVDAVHSRAEISDIAGYYRAAIVIDRICHSETTGATVERSHGEYLHTFTEQDAKRAASLITSLAAKVLGDSAILHADEQAERVNVARNAFIGTQSTS